MERGSDKDKTRFEKIVANFFYFDFMRVLIAKRSREGQNFICQFFFLSFTPLYFFCDDSNSFLSFYFYVSCSSSHLLTHKCVRFYAREKQQKKQQKNNKKKKTRIRQKKRRGDTRECKIFRTRPNGNNLSRTPQTPATAVTSVLQNFFRRLPCI